mgnify:CR=1 FL=1
MGIPEAAIHEAASLRKSHTSENLSYGGLQLCGSTYEPIRISGTSNADHCQPQKAVTVTDEDDVPFADPESWYSLIGKKKLENLIGQLHAKGHHKLYINENGQIYIQNGDTAEIKDCFDYFPPRNYWDILISIFQKDELTAKEKDQALELSWIKE